MLFIQGSYFFEFVSLDTNILLSGIFGRRQGKNLGQKLVEGSIFSCTLQNLQPFKKCKKFSQFFLSAKFLSDLLNF